MSHCTRKPTISNGLKMNVPTPEAPVWGRVIYVNLGALKTLQQVSL